MKFKGETEVMKKGGVDFLEKMKAKAAVAKDDKSNDGPCHCGTFLPLGGFVFFLNNMKQLCGRRMSVRVACRCKTIISSQVG